MTVSDKEKRKRYPPSNTASHYYTDPVNSVDLYGFVEDYNDVVDEINNEAADLEDLEFIDEPVESWGWINNADDGQFKEKRGY